MSDVWFLYCIFSMLFVVGYTFVETSQKRSLNEFVMIILSLVFSPILLPIALGVVTFGILGEDDND